jgi:hypothetical protein
VSRHKYLKRRRLDLGAECIKETNDSVGFKAMFQLIHQNHGGLLGSASLEASNQKPCGAESKATKRNAILVVKRNCTATEGDRVCVQKSLDFISHRDAQVPTGIGNYLENSGQLALSLLSERRAGVTCSLDQGC